MDCTKIINVLIQVNQRESQVRVCVSWIQASKESSRALIATISSLIAFILSSKRVECVINESTLSASSSCLHFKLATLSLNSLMEFFEVLMKFKAREHCAILSRVLISLKFIACELRPEAVNCPTVYNRFSLQFLYNQVTFPQQIWHRALWTPLENSKKWGSVTKASVDAKVASHRCLLMIAARFYSPADATNPLPIAALHLRGISLHMKWRAKKSSVLIPELPLCNI